MSSTVTASDSSTVTASDNQGYDWRKNRLSRPHIPAKSGHKLDFAAASAPCLHRNSIINQKN